MAKEQSTAQYRYPGVTPFSTDQAAVFFGRNAEIDELYRLIRREALVVLYGKSGFGKSSLLNAGIVPRCVKEGEFSPVLVRFGAWTENATHSPLGSAKAALSEGYAAPTFLERLLPGDGSLWHCAKTRLLNGGGRPVLIFDQFEELFSYPEEQVKAFREELSELLHTGIPLRFRRKAEAEGLLSEEEEERFEAPLEARVVFAIRSDRMHLLDRLKDELPNVLRHCFEVKALLPADARDAILLPARASGRFQTAAFDFSPAALQKLLDFLRDPQDGRIEGILLQMLCEHYERRLVEAQGARFLDDGDIGDPEQVVKKYYEEKISGLDAAQQQPARLLIEDGLVSEGEAMRLSLHESYILHEFGADKNLLERLVDSRLLRSEPFLRGGYTYELSHDRLVPPVLAARALRREEEAQREAERREAERQQQLEAAREKAEQEQQLRLRAETNEQRAFRRTQLAVIISLVALALAIVAGWNYVVAQKAQENAVIEKEKAVKALADFQKEQADKLKLEFDALAARANSILEIKGCPLEILQQMRSISALHPDSIALRAQLQTLYDKNPNCK